MFCSRWRPFEGADPEPNPTGCRTPSASPKTGTRQDCSEVRRTATPMTSEVSKLLLLSELLFRLMRTIWLDRIGAADFLALAEADSLLSRTEVTGSNAEDPETLRSKRFISDSIYLFIGEFGYLIDKENKASHQTMSSQKNLYMDTVESILSWMWSGESLERSTSVREELGLIPTQDGIFYLPFSDNGLKSLFLQLVIFSVCWVK